MKKSTKRKIKKKFNLIFGTLLFVLLISSAFAIDWIFGLGFIFSFVLAVSNKVLEKNFLIPIFIFIGAWIIRYSLNFIPRILNAQDYISLGISLILFLAILFIGWRIKAGKFKF